MDKMSIVFINNQFTVGTSVTCFWAWSPSEYLLFNPVRLWANFSSKTKMFTIFLPLQCSTMWHYWFLYDWHTGLYLIFYVQSIGNYWMLEKVALFLATLSWLAKVPFMQLAAAERMLMLKSNTIRLETVTTCWIGTVTIIWFQSTCIYLVAVTFSNSSIRICVDQMIWCFTSSFLRMVTVFSGLHFQFGYVLLLNLLTIYFYKKIGEYCPSQASSIQQGTR